MSCTFVSAVYPPPARFFSRQLLAPLTAHLEDGGRHSCRSREKCCARQVSFAEPVVKCGGRGEVEVDACGGRARPETGNKINSTAEMAAVTVQGAIDAERKAKVGVARDQHGAVPLQESCAGFFIQAFLHAGGVGALRRLERPAGILSRASPALRCVSRARPASIASALHDIRNPRCRRPLPSRTIPHAL